MKTRRVGGARGPEAAPAKLAIWNRAVCIRLFMRRRGSRWPGEDRLHKKPYVKAAPSDREECGGNPAGPGVRGANGTKRRAPMPRSPRGRQRRDRRRTAARRCGGEDRPGGAERHRAGGGRRKGTWEERPGASTFETVEKQLASGFIVSPSGALFTSPFFLLAASLRTQKSALGKKSVGNIRATGNDFASVEATRGCNGQGYDIVLGLAFFISVDPFKGKVGRPLS